MFLSLPILNDAARQGIHVGKSGLHQPSPVKYRNLFLAADAVRNVFCGIDREAFGIEFTSGPASQSKRGVKELLCPTGLDYRVLEGDPALLDKPHLQGAKRWLRLDLRTRCLFGKRVLQQSARRDR